MSDIPQSPTHLFSTLPWSQWPAVLPRTPQDEILPLKVGIGPELEALLPDDPEARKAFRKEIRKYTRSIKYLEAVATECTYRYDVDGNPVGDISEMDRLSAALMIQHKDQAFQKQGPRKPKGEDKPAPTQAPVPPPAQPEPPAELSIRDRVLKGNRKVGQG